MKDVRVVFGLTKVRLDALLSRYNGRIDIDKLDDKDDVSVWRYTNKRGKRSLEYGMRTQGLTDWVKFDIEFVCGNAHPVQPLETSVPDWCAGKPRSWKKKYSLVMLGHPLGLPLVLSRNKWTLTKGTGDNAGRLVAPFDSINGYSGAPVLASVKGNWQVVGLCAGTDEMAKEARPLRDLCLKLLGALLRTRKARKACILTGDKGVNLLGEGAAAILPYYSFQDGGKESGIDEQTSSSPVPA